MLKNSTILHIGIDDTDSPKGMCTTFLSYKIVKFLEKQKAEFVDYPSLIRFNPNIPWKTRGNGAVRLTIKTRNPNKIKKEIIQFITNYSDTKNGANPGLVFFQNQSIPQSFHKFSRLALWKLISRKTAKDFISNNKIDSFYLGNGQGLVGAIGAIGYKFSDHTFELLCYRKKSQFGKKRVKSVVLASTMVDTDEELDGYMVFKSNQGTADHLKNELQANDLRPYTSGFLVGKVCSKPVTEQGGHVFFSIQVGDKKIRCGVYKQTKITKTAQDLIPGDKIRLGGGIRKASKNYERVLNVEFLDVIKLEKNILLTNPTCKTCNKKMKSKGNRQGFECFRCGNKSFSKSSLEIPRKIQRKLYLPAISAHRHLTRPYQRLKKRNKFEIFDTSLEWLNIF